MLCHKKAKQTKLQKKNRKIAILKGNTCNLNININQYQNSKNNKATGKNKKKRMQQAEEERTQNKRNNNDDNKQNKKK